ncbi:hypothetical protein THOM_1933, partial [Trachipleistophora hominis]
MVDLIQNREKHVLYRRLKIWMNEHFWECGDGIDLLREDVMYEDEGFIGMFSAIGLNEDAELGKDRNVVREMEGITEQDRETILNRNMNSSEKSAAPNKCYRSKSNQPMQYTAPSRERGVALFNLYAMEQCCYETCTSTKEPFFRWYANNNSFFTPKEKMILLGQVRGLSVLNNLLYEITFKRLSAGECFVRSVEVFRKMNVPFNGVVNVLRMDCRFRCNEGEGNGYEEKIRHVECRGSRDYAKVFRKAVNSNNTSTRAAVDHKNVLPFSFASRTLSDILNARNTPYLTNNHILNLLILYLSDKEQFNTYINSLITRTKDWQDILSLLNISSFSVVSYLNRLPIDALPRILEMTSQSNYVLQFYVNTMTSNEQIFELLCMYENAVTVKGSFIRWVINKEYKRIKNCSLVHFIQLYNTMSATTCNRDLLFVLKYKLLDGDELVFELLEKMKDWQLSNEVLLKAIGHIIRIDDAKE